MTVSVKTIETPNKDHATIHREVLAIVEAAHQRITPGELKKQLSGKNIVDKKALKAAIKDLVLRGELKYTYQFGCTFIEKSYERPIRISNRVVLKPPDIDYEPATSEIVIDILKGASFGFGDHPTTRLSLQGVEAALFSKHIDITADDCRSLDIGTGTGVLAIAAVLIGIKRAVGIDIDPCARAEAKKNVKLNGLEHKIKILDTRVEDINEAYSLITANLRYPTLRRICPHLAGITQKRGAVVVSGIKLEEIEDLLGIFAQNSLQCTWKASEKGWAGLAFILHEN